MSLPAGAVRRTMALLLPLTGCAEPAPGQADRPVPELPRLVDIDPAPEVVEVHVEATVARQRVGEGPPAEVWAYRDRSADGEPAVPGPLVEVAVGQTLKLHLHNALAESTTLHLHGVSLPNEMDGSEVTQMLVRPGEEHHYELVVTRPGTFWYHPHFDAADQLVRGLHGPGVSTGDHDLAETADRVFVLTDVVVDPEGRPIYEVDPEVWRFGRQGSMVLVNGAVAGEDLVLTGTSRERWRFINAAPSRYFRLVLDGHVLHVVAGDAGPVRTPWTTASLVVAPGDRFEVVVEPRPGRWVLRSEPVDRGFDLPEEDPIPLLTVVGSNPTAGLLLNGLGCAEGLPPLPSARDGMPPVELAVGASEREIVLSEGTAPNGEPLFFVNDQAWPFSDPVPVTFGESETWVVRNETAGNQPFHLHGLFFDVVGTNGAAPLLDSREDVADVPPFGEVRLAVPFEAEGDWMFHTHLLDQASHGMMSVLSVQAPAQP